MTRLELSFNSISVIAATYFAIKSISVLRKNNPPNKIKAVSSLFVILNGIAVLSITSFFIDGLWDFNDPFRLFFTSYLIITDCFVAAKFLERLDRQHCITFFKSAIFPNKFNVP